MNQVTFIYFFFWFIFKTAKKNMHIFNTMVLYNLNHILVLINFCDNSILIVLYLVLYKN